MVNVEFNEVVKGMYISEDEKGLVIGKNISKW